jgi:endonuclease/exonuclease/phosphatase (EEP) superfamily protein YafD
MTIRPTPRSVSGAIMPRRRVDTTVARGHHGAMILRLTAAVLLAAALSGCVIVPERQYALVSGTGGKITQRWLTCSNPVASEIVHDGALDADAVRIASWNLHKQIDTGWEAELGHLIGNSDVLLLQEAGLDTDLGAAIERGGLSWVLASAFAYAGADYGVLTATRVAPAAVCTLRAFEPLLGIPKSALITDFEVKGRDATLAIANLHAINFTPGTTAYSAQLDALGDALAAHRGPIVIAGDFNTWSDDRDAVVRALAMRLSLVPVAFATDARRRFFGHVFDRFYVRGVDVIDASAWPVTSSDHNPLLVTLRIR